MLRVNSVEVRYMNVILVLKGVSLSCEEGGAVSLLGANGAGKSTTLKAISGMLKSEEGRVTDGFIEFDGERIDNKSAESITRKGILQVMEGRRMAVHLTVEENVVAGTLLHNIGGAELKRDLDMVYDYFPRLKERRSAVAGYCSGGEQQMMVIARAMVAKPKIILLDEPSLGLAPLLVQEIAQIIRQINQEEKIAVVLVEQNARVALDVTNYGYLLENGRVVLDGSSDKLKENEDIREFYLGLTGVGKQKSYREVKHYKRRKRWLG